MSDLEALIRAAFAGKTHQFSVVRTRQGFQGNAVRPGGEDQRICVEIKPDPVDALRFVLMRVLDRDAEVNAAVAARWPDTPVEVPLLFPGNTITLVPAVGDDLLGIAETEDLIG